MANHLKASPPERYEEISRHLLAQAQEELDRGDILQASDKVWGATAHAVKAVCQRMGWNHHAHNHLSAAANYVASGLNRQDLMEAFGFLEAMHTNYYEHQKEADQVKLEVDGLYSLLTNFGTCPWVNCREIRGICLPSNKRDQERRLRMLTRRNQYSHGPEFNEEEVASLPPVTPPSSDTGQEE